MVHIHLDQCRSTREILKENYTTALEQYLISTERQTAGVGRRGNKWVNADRALAFSFNTSLNEIPTLTTLEVAVLIAEFYQSQDIQLKWPNDIYYSNKKIGGILCESKIKNKEIDKIVIGIGINVNETIEEHPDNIHNDISTMSSITNHAHQRELIVAEFVNYFERLLNNISENSKMIIDEWQNLCMHMNQNISFHEKEKTNEGIFIGLNKEGYAKIEIDEKIQNYSSIHLI